MITFFFTHIAVSNPCAEWTQKSDPVAIQQCQITQGFNQPLYIQFERYFTGLLSGNWGTDQNGLSVIQPIVQAVPATLELVLASLAIMVIVGIPLGVIAATNSGRWGDHLVRVFYLSGWATPTYLGAIVIALVIGPALGLPRSGAYTSTPPFPQPTHMSVVDALLAGNLYYAADATTHLILPAVTLAFVNLGIVTRMTRSTMLEVLPLEYVKTARMKGLEESRVVYRHALRNSLITTVTVLGITAGALLSGTVVIEKIFDWPGIGNYAYQAIVTYNFPGTIAVVVVFAVAVVIANLIADILYGILDPRVEWR